MQAVAEIEIEIAPEVRLQNSAQPRPRRSPLFAPRFRGRGRIGTASHVSDCTTILTWVFRATPTSANGNETGRERERPNPPELARWSGRNA
jgi:hypothetical protein